jgi:tyrosyl-tRNA synthetase
MWASELAQDSKYWEMVIQVGKHATLSRVKRALPIMGRSFNVRDVDAASLFYPCMQVADIFYLDLDVACAGMDQRKAHMLAREVSTKMDVKKPISLHTHLLMGLEGPSPQPGERFDEDEKLNLQITTKMSKSKPSKCVFIHDSPDEIREKIRNAYCPPRMLENNPVIELVEYIVFPAKGELTINRPSKYGGTVTFTRLEELKEAYSKGTVHPLDLKVNVAEALVEVLSPVRNYFKHHENILEEVKKITVKR